MFPVIFVSLGPGEPELITVKGLKALQTADCIFCPETLARKMETEMEESWYTGFYHQLRAEMDEYYHAKRRLRLVKENTEYEEDLYDEAV